MTKQRTAVASILLITLLLTSCDLSWLMGKDQAGHTPQAPLTLADAAKLTLQNLPELKLTLPKSLRADSETARKARALGDTTELTADMLPGLKSQAWFDLQNNSGSGYFMEMINKAFNKLKAYADANTIPANEAFTLPVSDDDLVNIFGMPEEMRGSVSASCTVKIAGSSTENFQIFINATLSFSQNEENVEVGALARIDAKGAYDAQALDMYFRIFQKYAGQEMIIPFYATYDAASGSSAMVMKQTIEAGEGFYIQSSTTEADGSIGNVNMSTIGGIVDYLSVAYGNDLAGGIASMNTYTRQIGSDAPTQVDSYWGEYYDAAGELIKRQNGEASLYPPIWGNFTNIRALSGSPFTSAPDTIKISSSWEYVNEAWINNMEYFDPTTETWNAIGSVDSGNLVYKDVDDADTWTPGDCIYYWKSGYSEGNRWVTELYKGYVVPAPEPKFGKQYYISTEYPLKRILPLSQDFASSYRLIQLEGETYPGTTWTDWEGNSQTWSWTNYTYFLNKNRVDENGVPLQEAIYEPEYDINLDKLQQYDMYYWTGSGLEKKRGHFWRTTAALPPYFSAPSDDLVTMVDSKLKQILDTAYDRKASDYAEEILVAESLTSAIAQ